MKVLSAQFTYIGLSIHFGVIWNWFIVQLQFIPTLKVTYYILDEHKKAIKRRK